VITIVALVYLGRIAGRGSVLKGEKVAFEGGGLCTDAQPPSSASSIELPVMRTGRLIYIDDGPGSH